MKNSTRSAGILMVISFCMAMPGFSEKQPSKGAKALFYDSTSGTTLQGTSRDAARPPAQVPRANAGLKYWVELVQPSSSQILRVSSTRALHSGERLSLAECLILLQRPAWLRKWKSRRAAKPLYWKLTIRAKRLLIM